MHDAKHYFDFFSFNQLLEGVLYGALGSNLPHAAECLRHPRNTWEKFGGAMSEMNFTSLGSMLHSIKNLGNNLCHLSVEMEGCWVTERDGTDLQRLKAMTQAFFSPWEFSFKHEPDLYTDDIFTHLLINGLDVFDELTDAKVHYENHNYYEFGYSLGYTLDQITMQ